jgi:membrane protease YdiL (CAAX protease family)
VKARQRIDLAVMRMQARYLVGFGQLFGSSPMQYTQAEGLNRGAYLQRLCFVTLAGEMAGFPEARKQLDHLIEERRSDQIEASENEQRLTELLDRLYRGYENSEKRSEKGSALEPQLTGEEQEELRLELGWFGELALTPAAGNDAAARQRVLAPAVRTAQAGLAFLVAFLLGLLAGVVLLVLVFVFWLLGRLHSGFISGSRAGGVYAETFALYLLLFLGLEYGLSHVPAGQAGLLVSGAAPLGSLAALAWPVLRGVPWSQVRQDLGLNAGRAPWLEPLLGVGCWLTALPLVLVGVFVSLALMKLHQYLGLGPMEAPAHPIVTYAARAGWWGWLQVVFVACVVAPIVEETMFRGALYRHLREASRGAGRILSVLLSALAASFVFAVIHPQGILGTPILMALAIAFTLAREWRGSLVPAMIAHGLNNGMATLLLALMTA